MALDGVGTGQMGPSTPLHFLSAQRWLLKFKVPLSLASPFLGWVTAMIRVIYEAVHSSLHFNNLQHAAAKIRF